tara:strand:+ start:511 stop:684 length:174 start_codon:yes stop_codon:yes gene_type:complete
MQESVLIVGAGNGLSASMAVLVAKIMDLIKPFTQTQLLRLIYNSTIKIKVLGLGKLN